MSQAVVTRAREPLAHSEDNSIAEVLDIQPPQELSVNNSKRPETKKGVNKSTRKSHRKGASKTSKYYESSDKSKRSSDYEYTLQSDFQTVEYDSSS